MIRLLQKDEWPLYAAFLPVLLTLAAIGVTAAIGWHNHPLRHLGTVSAIRSDTDDYFQGLARLGIAEVPTDERPSITPVIAH